MALDFSLEYQFQTEHYDSDLVDIRSMANSFFERNKWKNVCSAESLQSKFSYVLGLLGSSSLEGHYSTKDISVTLFSVMYNTVALRRASPWCPVENRTGNLPCSR